MNPPKVRFGRYGLPIKFGGADQAECEWLPVVDYIRTKRVLSNAALSNYMDRKRAKRERNMRESPLIQKAKRWVRSARNPDFNPCDPSWQAHTRVARAATKRTDREADHDIRILREAKRRRADGPPVTKPVTPYSPKDPQ
jgi:hypothetical protein